MTTFHPDIVSDEQENIQKDWDWWSNFLQREYYGGPDEKKGWDAAARSVSAQVGLKPGMRVLDLGSGSGEMVMRLGLQGVDAVGVEQSATLVDNCRSVALERGVMVQFIAASMFEYQPEQQFDVILSLNTSFGYGTDQQNRELIAKIGSWLPPGGVFYCDMVSADSATEFGVWNDTLAGGTFIVDNRYDKAERRMISYPAWIAPDGVTVYTATSPEVVQLYTRSDLEAMMQAAGMKPSRLDRAMGRQFRQTDDDMLTTWIARRV